MMLCKQAKSLMDDYLDGYLDDDQECDLVSHLSLCLNCQGELNQRRALLTELRAIAVPEPSPGFAKRVLSHAGHGHRARLGFATGFGSAIAAGLLVWFAVGIWQPASVSEDDALSVIALQVAQPHEVSLAFNAPYEIQDVTFRIQLPEGVELQGYPSQRELTWNDRLYKGRNVMNLNLIANQGADGELLAYINHGGKERVFRLPITASMNGVGVTHPLLKKTISI